MGLFSWCTSDTKKSISLCMDGYEGAPQTVYLLNPFGEAFKETSYGGYGIFGGQDAYALVAKWNAPEKCKDENGEWLPDDKIRDIGIDLACYDDDHVQLKYPIKIVEELCPYEKADISPCCPFQGHFYPDWDEMDELKEKVEKAFCDLDAAKYAYAEFLACEGNGERILTHLHFDSHNEMDKAFIKIASKHSETPEAAFMKIASEGNIYQKRDLLCNENLPLSVLRILENSNEDWLQKNAQKRIEHMINRLAGEIDQFSEEYDPYEYADQVSEKEENVSQLCRDIKNGNVTGIKQWLTDIIEEDEVHENVEKAKELLGRLEAFGTSYEKTSLAAKISEAKERITNAPGSDAKVRDVDRNL